MRIAAKRLALPLLVTTLCLSHVTGHALAQADESPLPVNVKLAFENIEWTGWTPLTEAGLAEPLRPIVLTHAGDGSNRVFVATQRGIVHVFPQDQQSGPTKVFLNIRSRVAYKDKENEEGLLGMAFHPKYEENGEFFIYYSTASAPHTSVISRFRVSADDPNQADAKFEQEIMRIKQPFWNHNGGTIAFGPDGYLYVGLGDGGAANDPHRNGQNLKTLLGSILRIDVDRKSRRRNYGIPKDNPFVKRRNRARPEIWAFGLRNVWRLSFDRETGTLWAGDVGQDLWEEVDIIQRGGNYGWNRREATHPFGPKGAGPGKNYIEPIWEYDHNVGKSITGGYVYRGKQVPELYGKYLYADYVSGKLWALHYDEPQKKVIANHSIPAPKLAVISYGETEDGEVYLTIVSPTGKGIYGFERNQSGG